MCLKNVANGHIYSRHSCGEPRNIGGLRCFIFEKEFQRNCLTFSFITTTKSFRASTGSRTTCNNASTSGSSIPTTRKWGKPINDVILLINGDQAKLKIDDNFRVKVKLVY